MSNFVVFTQNLVSYTTYDLDMDKRMLFLSDPQTIDDSLDSKRTIPQEIPFNHSITLYGT